MDNSKKLFVPEEALRKQRVELYLNDLKERLRTLHVRHDEVIQNSSDIIREIDDVSSELRAPKIGNVNKIKKLIKDFETVKTTNSAKPSVSVGSNVDIQKMLKNFEQLHESHRESLVLFKRAKESFQKIDTYLGKTDSQIKPNPNNAPNDAEKAKGTCTRNESFKNKISNILTEGKFTPPLNTNSCCCLKERPSEFEHLVAKDDAPSVKATTSGYASCRDSLTSIDVFRSSIEIGYEGDNDDSEYDHFEKKKFDNKKNN